MRLLVISDLPQFVTGGAEMQAARLISAWASRGHAVACLGRNMAADHVMIDGHRIAVDRIGVVSWLGRPGRAASYFLSLSWLLLRRRRSIDAIYCRFLGDAAATVSVLKRLGLLSVPLIATPANAGKGGDIDYLRSAPRSQALIELIDAQCDAINLIAPKMVGDLRAAGFHRARLTEIPNGIPVAANEARDVSGPIRVTSVGRLAPQKGYDLLIDALARRPELAGKLVVEVIGDGPDRAELEHDAARRLPAGLLRFSGEMTPSEVRAQLQRSDLFLLSSRYEGMSNAALEAMERSLPVVITRCGGIDTFVAPTMGWLADIGDVPQLSDALALAAATPRHELRRMGAHCRALVEEKFDMGSVAVRYLALFQQIIDDRAHDD